MDYDAFNGAVTAFEGLSFIGQWVESLSKLIGLIPNFLQAFGF